MTPAFVGFIIVALVGGAAEMASALSAARQNRMDLSVSIGLGSALQIALFVAPVLVLLSYVIAPACSGDRDRADEPNQPIEHGTSHQFSIISGFQLSAIVRKPSLGNAAAAPNPHRRSSAHRFPAGSFFGGFRTLALCRIERSCSGRHPKPFPIADLPALASDPRSYGRRLGSHRRSWPSRYLGNCHRNTPGDSASIARLLYLSVRRPDVTHPHGDGHGGTTA
jgi:hypothetical protein